MRQSSRNWDSRVRRERHTAHKISLQADCRVRTWGTSSEPSAKRLVRETTSYRCGSNTTTWAVACATHYLRMVEALGAQAGQKNRGRRVIADLLSWRLDLTFITIGYDRV